MLTRGAFNSRESCRSLRAAVDLAFSYPLALAPAREIIEKSLLTNHSSHIDLKRNIIRVILVFATFCLAFFPQFDIIVNIVGGWSVSVLSFVLPCLMLMQLRRFHFKAHAEQQAFISTQALIDRQGSLGHLRRSHTDLHSQVYTTVEGATSRAALAGAVSPTSGSAGSSSTHLAGMGATPSQHHIAPPATSGMPDFHSRKLLIVDHDAAAAAIKALSPRHGGSALGSPHADPSPTGGMGSRRGSATRLGLHASASAVSLADAVTGTNGSLASPRSSPNEALTPIVFDPFSGVLRAMRHRRGSQPTPDPRAVAVDMDASPTNGAAGSTALHEGAHAAGSAATHGHHARALSGGRRASIRDWAAHLRIPHDHYVPWTGWWPFNLFFKRRHASAMMQLPASEPASPTPAPAPAPVPQATPAVPPEAASTALGEPASTALQEQSQPPQPQPQQLPHRDEHSRTGLGHSASTSLLHDAAAPYDQAALKHPGRRGSQPHVDTGANHGNHSSSRGNLGEKGRRGSARDLAAPARVDVVVHGHKLSLPHTRSGYDLLAAVRGSDATAEGGTSGGSSARRGSATALAATSQQTTTSSAAAPVVPAPAAAAVPSGVGAAAVGEITQSAGQEPTGALLAPSTEPVSAPAASPEASPMFEFRDLDLPADADARSAPTAMEPTPPVAATVAVAGGSSTASPAPAPAPSPRPSEAASSSGDKQSATVPPAEVEHHRHAKVPYKVIHHGSKPHMHIPDAHDAGGGHSGSHPHHHHEGLGKKRRSSLSDVLKRRDNRHMKALQVRSGAQDNVPARGLRVRVFDSAALSETRARTIVSHI